MATISVSYYSPHLLASPHHSRHLALSAAHLRPPKAVLAAEQYCTEATPLAPKRRTRSRPVHVEADEEEEEEKRRRGRGRPKSRPASSVQTQFEEEANEWPDGNVFEREVAELGEISEDDDVGEEEGQEEDLEVGGGGEERSGTTQPRPRELFVCNLPRRCDVSDLLELFKPYGTVISVEISRDAETGISRGCGFVTMRSLAEARSASNALDGYDLDGREILVKLSSDVSSRRNSNPFYTPPKKDQVFESPHKIYVGNISWSVQPQDLREYFSQCGTVVSTRLLIDQKGGKSRAYGFLSFSSANELEAALKLDNTNFHGRSIIVREAHINHQMS